MPPTKLVIPVVAADQLNHGKECYFISIVRVSDIPFDKIPLDANLRRAKGQSRTVKNMIQTLKQKPQDFFKSNLGIVVMAEEASFIYDAAGNPTKIAIKMLGGIHGVANGGHTLSAIQQAWEDSVPLADAFVAMRVHVGVSDETLKSSVVHLNTAEKVDKRSIFYKYGTFDNIKAALEALGFKNINYYQNQALAENRTDSTRQNVIHPLKLITAMDSTRFAAKKKQHPVSIMGAGNIVMDVKAIERAEALILDFLPIAVQMENLICKKAVINPRKLPGVKVGEGVKDTIMLDGTVIAANIASIFALPIISALRAFIEEDKWKIPIQELLPQIADELWKDYSAYLRKNWDKEQRNLTGTLRNEEVWINLHVSATEFQTRYLRSCLARNAETNGQNPTQVKEINKALS